MTNDKTGASGWGLCERRVVVRLSQVQLRTLRLLSVGPVDETKAKEHNIQRGTLHALWMRGLVKYCGKPFEITAVRIAEAGREELLRHRYHER